MGCISPCAARSSSEFFTSTRWPTTFLDGVDPLERLDDVGVRAFASAAASVPSSEVNPPSRPQQLLDRRRHVLGATASNTASLPQQLVVRVVADAPAAPPRKRVATRDEGPKGSARDVARRAEPA